MANNSIKIDTGIKCIEIERDGQPAGVLEFNPYDTRFAEKFYRMVGQFENKVSENKVRAKEIDANNGKDEFGVPDNIPDTIELQKELFAFCCEQIDAVFGEGTSAMVLGDVSNIDVFFQFIDGVTPHFKRVRATKVANYTPKPKSKRPKSR